MYTDEDKDTKHKKTESRSKKSNHYNDYYSDYYNVSYDEDFYKNFSDEDNINTNTNADNLIDYSFDYSFNNYEKKSKKRNVNKLDTSYTEEHDDNQYYDYDRKTLDKKKYTVIIIILVIFFIALVCILIRIINVKNPPVGNNFNYVRLHYDQLDLKIGDTKKLDLILSNTSDDYKIEWFSNNDKIVSVDNNGNIFALNEGNAVILVAYYLNDNVYDAQCHITVSK